MTSNYRKTTSNTYTAQDYVTIDTLYLNNITDISGNSVNQVIADVINTLVDPSTDDMNILALQTSKANLSGGNTFSGIQTFSSIPALGSDLTNSINSDNQLVTKKFVDNSISSATNSILSSNNTFTGTNQFNNSIGVQNVLTASSSNGVYISTGLTLASLPRMTIEAIPSHIRDLTPKKYVDDQDLLKANLSGGNTFSGTQTYNNVITYGSDLTSSINNNNHLVNKKYVDDSFTTFLSNHNTFNGNIIITGVTEITNSFTVANVMSCSVGGGLSYTFLPRIQSVISPQDEKDLTTKKYVDETVSSSVSASKDTFIVGLQTKLAPNGVTNYYFISPPANSSSWDCYINFPTTSDVNTLYSHACTFDFNYYYTQANAISGGTISALGSGATGQTYQIATLPSQSVIQACSASGINPNTYITCKFCVSVKNGFVYVNAPYQSTTIWLNPSNATGAVTARGIVNPISMKYGTTQGTYAYTPINITYVSATKVKISVLFPIINYNTVSNDPRQSGWIDACGASIKLNASNPCSTLYNNPMVLTPSLSANSNSGGAWLSLS